LRRGHRLPELRPRARHRAAPSGVAERLSNVHARPRRGRPRQVMRVVIVGGGISGLSAAYYLAKRGVASTLIEREGRLGGVISTERLDGCVLEAGPDSFLAQKPWALHLIRELGLGGDVIGS